MLTLNKHGYPEKWPQATDRVTSVVSRITHDQKRALYERVITTRNLAKELGVTEVHLSYLFPGKVTVWKKFKQELTATRLQYRRVVAEKVVAGEFTIIQAADAARTSSRTMARMVQTVRRERKNEARV